MSILVICAVAAERYAVVRNLGSATPTEVAGLSGVTVDTSAGELQVFDGGPGPVAAALSTASLLALGPEYDLVISAGIAGGFRGRAEIGDIVLADQVIAADQGVMTDEGFSTLRDLGLPGEGGYAVGNVEHRARLASGPYRLLAGDILTLSSMTGTDARAAELASRYPRAVAEAMEGYGVIEATRRSSERTGRDIPFAEIRAISNIIGRRDRSTWNIPLALGALADAMSTLLNEPLP
ncbi:MAG TPA: futalosine hydrolase [Acidothermaceae bacterium]